MPVGRGRPNGKCHTAARSRYGPGAAPRVEHVQGHIAGHRRMDFAELGRRANVEQLDRLAPARQCKQIAGGNGEQSLIGKLLFNPPLPRERAM